MLCSQGCETLSKHKLDQRFEALESGSCFSLWHLQTPLSREIFYRLRETGRDRSH